jgi:hypothetical protein
MIDLVMGYTAIQSIALWARENDMILPTVQVTLLTLVKRITVLTSVSVNGCVCLV